VNRVPQQVHTEQSLLHIAEELERAAATLKKRCAAIKKDGIFDEQEPFLIEDNLLLKELLTSMKRFVSAVREAHLERKKRRD
jgi:hypothetical protein